MSPTGAPGPVFRRVRVRLTLYFGLLALLGFGLFGTVLAVRDAEFDRQRVDAILRGEASRAAALVYAGQDGRPSSDGLVGDHVRRQSQSLLVVHRQGDGFAPIFASGTPIDGDWSAMASACLVDGPEAGTTADIGDLRVAGVPWWLDQSDPGPSGCALAGMPRRTILEGDLTAPGLIGSGVLIALLTALVWWAAGRSLKTAEGALADRERFLATAAHEMRGPLARMRAVSEAALRELPHEDPETAARLRVLVATAESAGRVASNLLLSSRIEHSEVPVQLAQVRLDELAFEVETSIDGVVVDVSEPVTVVGDAMLLRQAMTNLVDNAQRHGRGDGGTSDVILTVTRHDGRPVVRVADDGPGFPDGLDVLRPYVSGAAGGNGLGLPLVRWIADRHDADLWFGPAGGRDGLDGAAVEIRFPTGVDGDKLAPR